MATFGTTDAAMLTGTVVVVGRWAEGKKLDIKVIVGSVFLAVGLTVIGMGNEKLGQQFAVLILVAALLRYFMPIAKKTGLTK
jgi:hypothetical protein